MGIQTVKIVHRDRRLRYSEYAGVMGERRIEIEWIGNQASIFVPFDWFPCNRAGLTKWIENGRISTDKNCRGFTARLL
jgi:hypothetical protein